MKYSTAVSVALAPLAFAKSLHNSYPLRRRTSHLSGSVVEGAAGVSIPGAEIIQGVQAVGSTQVIVIWANPGNGAETTTLNQQVTVTQTVTAGAAEATAIGSTTVAAGATGTIAGTGATHSVMVGGTAGLVYTPSEVQAAVGDMVVFTFMSTNHTVTQSGFTTPCVAMEGGMDSGFQPNADNAVNPPPQVAMQVMSTDPTWFYCRQTGHCGKGMTFSINPTAEKTQAMFQAMAIAQNGAGAGSAITGNATVSTGAGSAAAASSSVAAGAALQTGTGVLEGGACVCAVTCGAGSFPAVNAQGLNNFGGIAGGIPASMVETV
ncbi:Cupredoxin [Xylariaceae sp. FL0016]|nr:Cupredoxin [Xylariaceae sp. FL0016]